jgi:hypothetical protein
MLSFLIFYLSIRKRWFWINFYPKSLLLIVFYLFLFK